MDEFADFNKEGLTPLFQLATALHQMYINFRQAGFTEQQALYLTSKMIVKHDDIDIEMEGE